ncbi:gliding motility-associated C-terminal domain-containing protein [Leptobacterium sp. I13]|uniref:gliding motility-associated C-terminal domain-containing protein n=1 Tax=Leptobacterium meishanense TaxID=3128904 RepID=UPI0030EDE22B
MKTINNLIQYILIFMWSVILHAQSAFHNYGSIQIHEEGQVGFHTNLIDDGSFDNNVGLAGFYSDGALTISGTSRPIFYDMEVAVPEGLFLETSVGITHVENFISGRIHTPKGDRTISLDFLNDAMFFGESDNEHIYGYASIYGKETFTFPLGDDKMLRPMTISPRGEESFFKGAYFYEDPNFPMYFNTNFSTSQKQLLLKAVSNEEFWDLKGSSPVTVTLTWDANSDVGSLATSIQHLRVVGWSISENQWVDLGNTNVSGSFSSGSITSASFVPDAYAVITVGSAVTGDLDADNYLMTPNGDGLNDYFVIEGIEMQPNNTLSIYNRWGSLVYEVDGYANTFNGVANVSSAVNKNKGLPTGVYYYILELKEQGITTQGYIYINR